MTHPSNVTTASSSNPAMTQSNDDCDFPGNTTFQSTLYATTYTIIFIPGLLANSAALWVLCRFISHKSKAVIFMINLAMADLAHVLSLPLRIYYYISHSWPFGNALCQVCFYLKYLNMYASICFLSCISIQRYFFLYHPFRAKDWKRRYDVAISTVVWLFVGVGCSAFPIMRSYGLATRNDTCFADLQVTRIDSNVGTVLMIGTVELLGFVVPLIIILFCTWKTRNFIQDFHSPEKNSGERQKALRMVSMCAIVFSVCFAPYNISFFFYMLVKENVITNCFLSTITHYIHPVCLSLASFDCCLDPIIYFFTTSEFQEEISRHSSIVFRSRLMSKESGSSIRE